MDLDQVHDAQPAVEYLALLQALTGELGVAMEAITANALSRLEDSVCRQQATCSRLGILADRLAPGQESLLLGAEPPLASRIRLAAGSLQELTGRYASLLRHSSESARIFAGLYQSYSGRLEPPAERVFSQSV